MGGSSKSGEAGSAAAEVQPEVLLLHDGELDDARLLLESLGRPFRERTGKPTPEDKKVAWALVIGSPARLLEIQSGFGGLKRSTVQIAISEVQSRTERAMIERLGVDFVVRRPVHAVALRLLVLHALHRGPEKRRNERVSIGALARFRTGLRRRPAVLADLSLTGCRLLTRERVETRRHLTVYLPPEVVGGKTLAVRGRVVRVNPAPGEAAGTSEVAVVLEGLNLEKVTRIRSALAAYAKGPATLPARRAADLSSDAATAGAAHVEAEEAGAEEAGGEEAGTPAESADAAAQAASNSSAEDGERRRARRSVFAQRVIAMGRDQRILLGRDLSDGGMRIDPNPALAVDDEFEIALPLSAREDPLVVKARVLRDDGERGLVLRFHDLGEWNQTRLRRMLDALPIQGGPGDGGPVEGAVVISEIVDRAVDAVLGDEDDPDAGDEPERT